MIFLDGEGNSSILASEAREKDALKRNPRRIRAPTEYVKSRNVTPLREGRARR